MGMMGSPGVRDLIDCSVVSLFCLGEDSAGVYALLNNSTAVPSAATRMSFVFRAGQKKQRHTFHFFLF